MPEPRHSPNATARAPSRYAVHRTAVTTAEDNEIGRSPGAQPRGPRAGFAAEGLAAATRRSRANERVNATVRSHARDRSAREALISASGSDKSEDSTNGDPAGGERKPDVAILPGAVNLASPVGTRDPVLELARDLEHSQAGTENIDGESDLDTPAPRQR